MYTRVARVDFAQASVADQNFVMGFNAQFAAGSLTLNQAIFKIGNLVDGTTSVAVTTYQFFTGFTPTQAGLDYLVNSAANPYDLNDAYYQNFNIENRYINFSVNLGKLGEGREAFSNKYGSLDLFNATKTAYGEIFGTAATDDKIHTILDSQVSIDAQSMTRANYFAYYGGDALGAKAAMVGWLLAEAVKSDVGLYARADNNFLHDLADDGGAQFHVNLITTYGPGTAYDYMT